MRTPPGDEPGGGRADDRKSYCVTQSRSSPLPPQDLAPKIRTVAPPGVAALILPRATRWQRRGSRIDGFDDLEVVELLAALRLLGWLQFLAGARCVAVPAWLALQWATAP